MGAEVDGAADEESFGGGGVVRAADVEAKKHARSPIEHWVRWKVSVKWMGRRPESA